MSKLTELLAREFNISGSQWAGGRQELMINEDGNVWVTEHTQNSWDEYHYPNTCVFCIDSNTDWMSQEAYPDDEKWQTDLEYWDNEVDFYHLSADEDREAIIYYILENDTLQVPVLEEIPENYKQILLDSGCSRSNSYPEYNWQMYVVYDQKKCFAGIYCKEDI